MTLKDKIIEKLMEEFDKKWKRELLVEMTEKEIEEYSKKGGSWSTEMFSVVNTDIKKWIELRLTQTINDLHKEIEKELDGMEVEIPSQVSNPDWGIAYNQALTDIKFKLNQSLEDK